MTTGFDYTKLRELAETLAIPKAVTEFPENGGRAIRAVIDAALLTFSAVDPMQVYGPVCIFSRALPHESLAQSSHPVLTQMEELRTFGNSGFCIEVELSGEIRIWGDNPPLPIEELSEFSIVFMHDEGNERYLINRNSIPLVKVLPGKQSFYSPRPAFSTLDDWLARYRYPIARKSDCTYLETIWFDENRLFLKAGPEKTIQLSLTRYLRYVLGGDAEVMREQNVNATQPVDIRVTFHFANRVALIEIKWLGKSKAANGDLASEWSASRGVDGAGQLANYLDEFEASSPDLVPFGYLVIFDARRRGLTQASTTITAAEGFYYEHEEIVFSPKYHLTRGDFKEPLRMFAEPHCI